MACAKRAAGYGKKVAVIEKNRVGGTCVNVGCMPKKIMYNAASIREKIYLAEDYGYKTTEQLDWFTLKQRRDEYSLFGIVNCSYIKRLNGMHARALSNNHVEYFEGFGHFVAPHQVQVGEGVILESDHILIATGDKPLMPSFPGSEYCGSSDSFWHLESLPKRSLVIGGGYIAVEMAGILNALGSDTFLACRKDTPLRTYDPFITSILMDEMKKSGISVFDNSIIDRIEKGENGSYSCYFQNGKDIHNVDYILMAAGRVPLLENLGLDIAGVQTDKGFVVVNDKEETTAPGVYCLGDNIGKVDLTPVAIQAGRRLADRLFNNQVDSIMDYTNVPSVVFSHPPIGTVGLTEPEARKIYGDDIKIFTSTFSNSLYALSPAEKKVKTGMKIVCQLSTLKVLGVHIIGDSADEILQGFAVAVKMGATKVTFFYKNSFVEGLGCLCGDSSYCCRRACHFWTLGPVLIC